MLLCSRREPGRDRGAHPFSEGAALGSLGGVRLVGRPRIAEEPGIPGEGIRRFQRRTKSGIDLHAGLAQIVKLVGLAERRLIPREERFQVFPGGLLRMEQGFGGQRGSAQIGGLQIVLRTPNPLARFRQAAIRLESYSSLPSRLTVAGRDATT